MCLERTSIDFRCETTNFCTFATRFPPSQLRVDAFLAAAGNPHTQVTPTPRRWILGPMSTRRRCKILLHYMFETFSTPPRSHSRQAPSTLLASRPHPTFTLRESPVRMLDVIEIDKHQHSTKWEMVVICVEWLHELLGTAIRSFLMSYIKELKVRTRQHSYGKRLALTRSTNQ